LCDQALLQRVLRIDYMLNTRMSPYDGSSTLVGAWMFRYEAWGETVHRNRFAAGYMPYSGRMVVRQSMVVTAPPVYRRPWMR
jgi:hypothetical protein